MTSKNFTLTDLFVLLAINPKYRYMARNKDGLLCAYESKPVKGIVRWCIDYDGCDWDKWSYAKMPGLDDECLSAISWCDDGPFVIPSREVIANVINNTLYNKVLTGEFNTEKGWLL